MEQHTETVEELKKTIEELQEDLDYAVKQNRTFCEANNLGYQVRRSLGKLGADAWNWKWVIILVVVEVYRFWIDQQNALASMDALQKIQGLIIDFMDLVKPGPRG
jgi:hypothetical protein